MWEEFLKYFWFQLFFFYLSLQFSSVEIMNEVKEVIFFLYVVGNLSECMYVCMW